MEQLEGVADATVCANVCEKLCAYVCANVCANIWRNATEGQKMRPPATTSIRLLPRFGYGLIWRRFHIEETLSFGNVVSYVRLTLLRGTAFK